MEQTFVTESSRMLGVLDRVSAVAKAPRPVIIWGERGTGKELIAHRLHFLSPRWGEGFVRVNCAALSETLLDAQLFGAEEGAFTGAVKRQAGLFEQAEGGTLFLDEVAHASKAVQQKLLRVIEYGEFQRLGGSRVRRADVRVIAASNQDLKAAVARNQFLPDLLDRLSFERIVIPPLRQRVEDLVPLALHFSRSFSVELGRSPILGIGNEAQRELEQHDWPGNVRELKNTVERTVFHLASNAHRINVWDGLGGTSDSSASEEGESCDGTPRDLNLRPHRLAPERGLASFGDLVVRKGLREFQREQEKEVLEWALQRSNHRQNQAAKLLGLSYSQLRALLRKHKN